MNNREYLIEHTIRLQELLLWRDTMDERRSRLSASLGHEPHETHSVSVILCMMCACVLDGLSACTVSTPEEGSLGPKQCDEVVSTQIVLRIHLQILMSMITSYMFS